MATVVSTAELLAVLPPEKVVCRCLQVCAGDVRRAIAVGEADSLRMVMQKTRAGTGCTCCHAAIQGLLESSNN